MKLKSIVTAMVMAGTFGAGAATLDKPGVLIANKSPVLGQITKTAAKKTIKSGALSKAAQAKFTKNKKNQAEYLKQNFHDGVKKYIVRLVDSAVPSYRGDVAGYTATKVSSKNSSFNAKSSESLKYVNYLETKQNEFVQKAASQGLQIPNLRSLKYAINGLVTELSFQDAQKLSKMPEVAFIEQSKLVHIQTDTGPLQIGAGDVWDGTATGSNLMGEGMIIGIIDTGVNTDHRSFAATGDDGYTVVNPLGANTYLGDCVADASLCTEKLIGVYSYSAVTDAYADELFAGDTRPANGEDYNGHGSHTASTAGGNVLLNVPLIGRDPASTSSTGDGVPVNGTTFTFDSMSGVAPHANIISYQICLPGNSGDEYAGCYSAAGIGAIDDAIADGVDVINYSIGGTTNFSPWTSATEVGYLNANAAGVFVAVSAGNSGPAPETTTKAAPWYTSVAATNHGRTLDSLMAFDGSLFTYTQSQGPALPDDLDAPVVDASVVDGGDVEGCDAFPADAFAGSTALISRGSCGFLDKINNATDAGAVFVIIYNNRDGDDHFIMGATSSTTIPAVMVSENTGDSMVASLAATPGLVASFDPSAFVLNQAGGDVMASFSSRGSNPFVDMIVPQIGAPGVNVYAAYADDQPFMDVNGPAPADFAFLSGTSMASPHLAGTAALVMQAHPDWNVDEVRSALMMTATTANTVKEDGVTPTDHFDIGAGRVQVDQAVNAGLVMSEITYNYEQADPELGGDVKTLNTPSMANFLCERVCSWTRTFTAKVDGTYAFSATNSAISSSPGSIEAVAGNDYTVSFVVNAAQVPAGETFFENVIITSSVAGAPELHLPVFAKITAPALPDSLDLKVGQNSGSYTVRGLYTTPTDNLTVVLDGMFGAAGDPVSIAEEFELDQDPTPASASVPYNDSYDDLYIGEEFEVGEGGLNMSVSLSNSTSPDFDLYIERLDGETWVLVGASAAAGSEESVSTDFPAVGTYRALVQNWEASSSGTDTGVINVTVSFQTDALPVVKIVQPIASNDGFTPFDVEFLWDWDLSVGDVFNGDITVMAGAAKLGTFPITITRVADDVTMSSDETDTVTRGDIIDYTINVNRNLYSDDLNYTLTVDLAAGTSVVEGSFVVEGGEADVIIKDPNAVGFSASEDFAIAEDSDNSSIADLTDGVFVFEFEVPAATLLLEASIRNSTASDNDLFIQMDRDGTGVWSTVATAATALADEETSIAAPEAGMYRAIVQNWASGSGLELDTGVLNIDLTPATGDGFIMNLTSNAVAGYSVTSSSLSASCAADGMSLFGEAFYTPLGSEFGVPSLVDATTGDNLAGDGFSFNVFGNIEFNHYGEAKTGGMTLTDDGFLMFSGDSGTAPWANQSIPNQAAPNDMLAMLWRDMVVVEDGTDRGVRAMDLYNDLGFGFVVLDFNGLQSWAGQDADGNFLPSDDQYSFSLWAYTDNSVLGSPYDYVVAYGDMAPNFRSSTAGAEDATGLFGIDVSDMIAPNSQLCYTAGEMGSNYKISYQVQTTAETDNSPITLTVESDMNNSDAFTDSATIVTANVAPVANAGEDITLDRAGLVQISLDGSTTFDLDRDQLTFTWTGPGEVSLHGTSTPRAFFNADEVVNGSYTFNLTVTDGEFTSSDEVTIVIEGVSATGDSGSMGFLLLFLGIPLLFRRRI